MNWIKTSEQRPERGQRCLVWNARINRPEFAYYSGEYWYYNFFGITRRMKVVINYWMPDSVIQEPKIEREIGNDTISQNG